MTSPSLPEPGTTVRRTTARVLPVRADGRVLLLHGWEPSHPERTYWFTIGGAAEAGEDLATAAARELAEEVDIAVAPAELGEPLGTTDNAFDWGEWHVQQTETYFAVVVDAPVVSLAGLDELERATTDRAGWWTPDDLDADGTAANAHLTSMMRTAISVARSR